MTIVKVLCYLLWLVPAMIGVFWSNWFILWAVIPFVLMGVLFISLHGGDGPSRKKLSYKFLYSWLDRKARPMRIDVCNIPSDTIQAMVVYPLVFMLVGSSSIIVGVATATAYVVGFFFAARPPVFTGDNKKETLVGYTRWPRVKGYRIWPSTFFVTVYLPILFADWIITSMSPTAVIDSVTTASSSLLATVGAHWLIVGSALGLIVIGLLVFKYLNSKHWHQSKKAIREVHHSFKEDHCIVMKVIDD